MSSTAGLLPEFDHEGKSTRRVLERVPNAHLAWQPHAKSMSLGRLATHIAEIPRWGLRLVEGDSFDIAPPGGGGGGPASLGSVAEILELFDQGHRAARAAIANIADEDLLTPWSLKRGGQVMFTQPRAVVLRDMLFNHTVHHRGQLLVYLRLLDVPVPGLYGPSADEPR